MKAAFVLLLCMIGVVSPACDPGWTQFKEDCIWFSYTAKTWIDAEMDCRKHGAWLMSDDNKEKHDFITSIVNAFKSFRITHFFIGGSDVAFENQWRWIETGRGVGMSDTPFAPWGIGEPDGNNSKNCLALKWQGNQTQTLVWSDENCGSQNSHSGHHHVHGALNYICEKLVQNNGATLIGR